MKTCQQCGVELVKRPKQGLVRPVETGREQTPCPWLHTGRTYCRLCGWRYRKEARP